MKKINTNYLQYSQLFSKDIGKTTETAQRVRKRELRIVSFQVSGTVLYGTKIVDEHIACFSRMSKVT